MKAEKPLTAGELALLKRLRNEHGGLVDKWTMAGVDVTEIVKALARERLIRHRWRSPSDIARDGYTVQRCLCITAKGIEELLS